MPHKNIHDCENAGRSAANDVFLFNVQLPSAAQNFTVMAAVRDNPAKEKALQAAFYEGYNACMGEWHIHDVKVKGAELKQYARLEAE